MRWQRVAAQKNLSGSVQRRWQNALILPGLEFLVADLPDLNELGLLLKPSAQGFQLLADTCPFVPKFLQRDLARSVLLT